MARAVLLKYSILCLLAGILISAVINCCFRQNHLLDFLNIDAIYMQALCIEIPVVLFIIGLIIGLDKAHYYLFMEENKNDPDNCQDNKFI